MGAWTVQSDGEDRLKQRRISQDNKEADKKAKMWADVVDSSSACWYISKFAHRREDVKTVQIAFGVCNARAQRGRRLNTQGRFRSGNIWRGQVQLKKIRIRIR